LNYPPKRERSREQVGAQLEGNLLANGSVIGEDSFASDAGRFLHGEAGQSTDLGRNDRARPRVIAV